MDPEKSHMIAPCGMHCSLCIGHVRQKRPCGGCLRAHDPHQAEGCRSCKISQCPKLSTTASGFCYDCDSFPCARLKNLDERYRSKYGMSMIANLEYLRERGLEAFLRHEQLKWACPVCGTTLCVHRDRCLHCHAEKPEALKHVDPLR